MPASASFASPTAINDWAFGNRKTILHQQLGPRSMNNGARRLVNLSLALLVISSISARAEDQPMASAPLPPPLPKSPPAAQSAPVAAAPQEHPPAKPAASDSAHIGNGKQESVHRARISSSNPKRGAAADRAASAYVKNAAKKHSASRGTGTVPEPRVSLRPPEKIAPGEQIAGAMSAPGPPPPYAYYPGYPPAFVPYPPAYQYPWPPGPVLPR
jgi:hypothetical protein